MMKGCSGTFLVIVGAIMFAGFGGPARADGDAGRGKQVFKKCAICHSLEPGKVKIGPPLHGLLGRKAGTAKRFNYSGAMKSANVVWSLETLDKYLAAPRKFIPGNRMPFPGLPNARDRADLLAYLEQAARGSGN